jgi:ABC-type multidrug transport system ATPase subunit
VELICDRVVFLKNGQVIAMGKTRDLLEDTTEFQIVAEGIDAAPSMAKDASRDGARLCFSVNASQQRAALDQIWTSGGTLISLSPKSRSLEELFVDLTNSHT